MKKNILKQNKGISMVDIAISILILFIFVGVISPIYVSIATNNLRAKNNAIATYFVVKLAEDIDKLSYNQVTKENLETLLSNREEFNYPDPEVFPFEINVEVKNYKEEQSKLGQTIAEDIIKIVEIKATYKVYEEEQYYSVSKLKIKENSI